MKTSRILAIALATSVISGAALAASGVARNPQSAAPADAWLTIPAVYDKVIAAGYSNIDEIEREGNGYEVKAIGPRGERVKLHVDPMNGKVLDVRAKQDKRDYRNQWEKRPNERLDTMPERAGNYRNDGAAR